MCEARFGGQFAAVWREDYPRARKPHVCDACGSVIPVGDQYVRIAALGDGSWSNAAACALCHWTAEAFAESHRFYPWPSELSATLRECVEEDGASWRSTLAALLRRYRVSAVGRGHLRRQWAWRAELARRVARAREGAARAP